MGCCCGKKPIIKQDKFQKEKSNNEVTVVEKKQQEVPLIIQNQNEEQIQYIQQKSFQDIQQYEDSNNKFEKEEQQANIEKQLPKIEDKPNPIVQDFNLIQDEINPIQEKLEDTQSDQDVKDFIDAISSIVEKNSSFRNSIQKMEESQGRHFRLDDNSSQNNTYTMSQQKNFIGPKITNKNICDIGNKYDFSQVQEFTEYKGDITIVRVIQKQKSPICTFIGKINNKYCCVKLIPMVNKDLINKWIQSVKNAQKQQNSFFNKYCQRYHFYKIEELNNQSEHYNCYIICELEQFNLYTFSHHQLVTLEEKMMIACDVIQIIELALQGKKNFGSENQTISSQIFSRMFTIKRNNLLISKSHQNNQNQYRIVLSDWQILLPEFEQIIPNKKIQNEDFIYQKIERNIQELDPFTKKVLMLIFFKVNFELLQNVEINGFIRETTSSEILQTLNKQENKHQTIFLISNIYNSIDQKGCKISILELINYLLQNTNTLQEIKEFIINLLQSKDCRNEILNAINNQLENEKKRQQKLKDINDLIQSKETKDQIQEQLNQLSQNQQSRQQHLQSIQKLLEKEENIKRIQEDINSFIKEEVSRNETLETLFNLFQNENVRMQFFESINNFSQDAFKFVFTKFQLNNLNNFNKIYQIYLAIKFQPRGEAIRSTLLTLNEALLCQKKND